MPEGERKCGVSFGTGWGCLRAFFPLEPPTPGSVQVLFRIDWTRAMIRRDVGTDERIAKLIGSVRVGCGAAFDVQGSGLLK